MSNENHGYYAAMERLPKAAAGAAARGVTIADITALAKRQAIESRGLETKEQAFVRLLTENPEAYEHYLRVEKPAFKASIKQNHAALFS